jgi:hypothetical protein
MSETTSIVEVASTAVNIEEKEEGGRKEESLYVA